MAALGAAALVGPAAAEPPRPLGQVAFQSFAAEQGLANLVVLSVAEDASGALWVGTDDGLYRIDGERVVRVGAGAALPSQHVYALAPAPNGELCVGLETGLACGRDGVFVATALRGGVRALAFHDGAVWVATEYALYVRRGGEPVVAVDTGRPGASPLLWADAAGIIAGRGAALATLATSGATGGWRALALDIQLDGDEPLEILRDRASALWLRGARHVWRVAPGSHRAEDVSLNLPVVTDAWTGRAMTVSPSGDVMLGSREGVATFRGDHWEMLDARRGLPTPDAHLVYFDRGGDLWVGSTGLHRALGRGLLERHGPSTGLPGDGAWAIARTPAGELLVGTRQCLVRAVGDHWACVAGTARHVVRTIAITPSGEVYFAGLPGTVHQLLTDGTVSPIAHLRATTGAPRILSMASGQDGTLWMGTEVGIWRRPPGDASAFPEAPPGGDPARFVSAVVADGPRMWFAGHEGLRMHDGAAWHRFTARDGLRATEVRYVARRRDGRLCVLYDQGLGVTCLRYRDGALAELRHVAAAEGLDAAMAYSLGEDRAGRLWLGTGAGLRVLTDDPTVAIDRFTARDGLAGDDATAMASFLDVDGDLWFGAAGGLSHVAASRYRGPRAAPSVRMLEVSLGDTRLATAERAPDARGATGDAPAADGGGVSLRAEVGARDLTARFVANAHSDAEVEYRVRLQPDTPQWSTVRGQEIRYAALPPGEHVLEVSARIAGGAWGEPTRTPCPIQPAWWERGAVRIAGAVLALALAATLGVLGQRRALRRRARALAEQTDASFRAFVASTPDVVIVRRADGEIYLNDAAKALTGPRRTAAGAWILRHIHPSDRRRAAALVRRDTPSAPGEHVELRMGAEGQWRDLEVTVRSIELAGALAHVVVGRDVTERRRMQARMLIADRMVSLGTLAAGMGHEINNPLSYVRSNLELISELLEGPLDPQRPALAQAVHEALDGADRVRAIVRSLGTFNHTSREVRVETSLAEVVAHAARLTHNELRHRARLVVETAAAPYVVADPGRLTQVVVNLLVNASHATPPGAADQHEIAVRACAAPDGSAVLEVEDHGVGMPPDVVARVFDPFFTTKRIGEGTGLGLSICHGIVTDLGGQIAVTSELGRGTIVRITLPSARPADPAAAPLPAHAPLAGDEPAVGGAEAPRGTPTPRRSIAAAPRDDEALASAAARPPASTAASPPASTAASPPASTAASPPASAAASPPASTAASPPAGTGANPPASAAAAPARAGAEHKLRVLIVDDEPSVGQGLGRMLRGRYDVTVLTDAEAAVRRVADGERFSVVITDLMMPAMTGLDLRDRLHAIAPDLERRVVLVTGGAFTPAIAERLERVDAPRLYKPFSGEELRTMVASVLEAAPPMAAPLDAPGRSPPD